MTACRSLLRRKMLKRSALLPPDNLRQKIVHKRLDLVRAENRHEGRSVRRWAGGKPVTRALGVGAVEPAGHLRARKPATDGLDKGRTVEPRLAQAWTGRKFATDATFASGAVALKASGLVPRCLTGRVPRFVFCEGGGRESSDKPNAGAYGARYPPPPAMATIQGQFHQISACHLPSNAHPHF